MNSPSDNTILVMEDDRAVRQSVVAYLEDRRFAVLEAENGREGMEVFRREKPDLVLVDLRMPEVNGLEVLATLSVESPETPAVVISGTGAITDAVEALHCGAWDYLLKPVEDMELLQHTVEKALDRAALIRKDREHREHLEESVRRRTAELEAKNAELERFAYTISHDLRSPLITISGFAAALEEDLEEGNRQEASDHLHRIRGAADKMAHFLDTLLELSRIERSISPPEPIPMNELVRETIDLLEGILTKQRVEVTLDPHLPQIRGDRQRLRQVLQNLIENAVKYMGAQSSPHIDIGSRREDDRIVFFVRDNGMGIDPRFHDRVFGLFNQVDPKTPGTGIGLALVRRIIEAHGGRIWVESEGLGHGCTFCFTTAHPPEPTPCEETAHGSQTTAHLVR